MLLSCAADYTTCPPLFSGNQRLVYVADGSFVHAYDTGGCPDGGHPIPVHTLCPSFAKEDVVIAMSFIDDSDVVVSYSNGYISLWSDVKECCSLKVSEPIYHVNKLSTDLFIGISHGSVSLFRCRANDGIVTLVKEEQHSLSILKVEKVDEKSAVAVSKNSIFFITISSSSSFAVTKVRGNYFSNMSTFSVIHDNGKKTILAIGDSIGMIHYCQIERRSAGSPAGSERNTDHFEGDYKMSPLANVHWHSTPVRTLYWNRESMLLYSGADEGVLCIWKNLLNSSSSLFVNDVHSKFKRKRKTTLSTAPMTLPGFACPIVSIAGCVSFFSVVTADNTLRVLPSDNLSNDNPVLLILGVKVKTLLKDGYRKIHKMNPPKNPSIKMVSNDSKTCTFALPGLPGTLQLVELDKENSRTTIKSELIAYPQTLILSFTKPISYQDGAQENQLSYYHTTYYDFYRHDKSSSLFMVTVAELLGEELYQGVIKFWMAPNSSDRQSFTDWKLIMRSELINKRPLSSLIRISDSPDSIHYVTSSNDHYEIWRLDIASLAVSIIGRVGHLTGYEPSSLSYFKEKCLLSVLYIPKAGGFSPIASLWDISSLISGSGTTVSLYRSIDIEAAQPGDRTSSPTYTLSSCFFVGGKMVVCISSSSSTYLGVYEIKSKSDIVNAWSYTHHSNKDQQFQLTTITHNNNNNDNGKLAIGYQCQENVDKNDGTGFGIMFWSVNEKIPYKIESLSSSPHSMCFLSEGDGDETMVLLSSGSLAIVKNANTNRCEDRTEPASLQPVGRRPPLKEATLPERAAAPKEPSSSFKKTTFRNIDPIFLIDQISDLPSHALPSPSILFSLLVRQQRQ